METYPNLEKLLSGEDPERLLEIRMTIRAQAKLAIAFIIAVFLVTLAQIYLYRSGLPLRWLALLPLAIGAEIARRHYNELYVIGRNHLTHYHGRISLNYQVPTVRFTDIRALNVNQDLLGRILDFGDIEIGTAGTESYEMTIKGIRAPTDLARLLDQIRNLSMASSIAAEHPQETPLSDSVNSD